MVILAFNIGGVQTLVMNPIDLLKIRLQVHRGKYQKFQIKRFVVEIIKKDGITYNKERSIGVI